MLSREKVVENAFLKARRRVMFAINWFLARAEFL